MSLFRREKHEETVQEQVPVHVPDGQCTKVTVSGRRCRLPDAGNGRCVLSAHQPERDLAA